jgi:hypothetical protein
MGKNIKIESFYYITKTICNRGKHVRIYDIDKD